MSDVWRAEELSRDIIANLDSDVAANEIESRLSSIKQSASRLDQCIEEKTKKLKRILEMIDNFAELRDSLNEALTELSSRFSIVAPAPSVCDNLKEQQQQLEVWFSERMVLY